MNTSTVGSACGRGATSRAFLSHARQAAAFSLIEVTLAIGIVAFAFIPILGMLPTGLGVFRNAMNVSVSAQIAQRLVSEAQQSDFDALVPYAGNSLAGVTLGGSEGKQFFALPLRYFDDQGNEVAATNPSKIVYTARVRGSLPGKIDPSVHKKEWFTSLPSTGRRFNPRDATILTVQVVNNPSNRDLEEFVDKQGTFLIDPLKARQANLALQTSSAMVARNGFRTQP